MGRIFTKQDREILEILRNGHKQQDFCIEPVIEEPVMDSDDDWAGISA